MLACMSSPPSWKLLWATSKAIRGMKRSGIWQKLDNWYIFDGPNEEWAHLNWKDPQPKFTPDPNFKGEKPEWANVPGWKPGDPVIVNDPKNPQHGDGVSDYIDTDWDPRAFIQEPPFPDEN